MQKDLPKFYPLVSIIMNCHNGEKYLAQSIVSIIAQTYKNWELIFWDNMSNDNSKKILKGFFDSRIKYFKSNKFLNLYASRNLAVKKAKGKYICFLDVDDLWSKEKIKKQIFFLSNNNKFKIAYTNYFIIKNKKNKKKVQFKKLLPSGKITQNLLSNYNLGIVTVMMEKNIFKNYKFKNFYNIIGDFDFFIRVSQKFNIGYIKEPLAFYRVHSSSLSMRKKFLYINEIKMWIKKNEVKLKKINLSLFKVKCLLFKLKLKSFFDVQND
jgi:glycosyltransferase involved in cell wall biosynthesis